MAEQLETWRTCLHIGGDEVGATGAATYAVVSPASGRHVATAADAGARDVDQAVAIAAEAFERGGWRRRTAASRAATLYRVAELLLERQERLALMESLCSGKPIRDCRAEVAAAARYFRFYAGIVPLMTGSTIPVNATGLDLTQRRGGRREADGGPALNWGSSHIPWSPGASRRCSSGGWTSRNVR